LQEVVVVEEGQGQPAAQWDTLTQPQREYIKTLYITGDMSLPRLCRVYMLDYNTVRHFAHYHNWHVERKAYQAELAKDEHQTQHLILADARRVASDMLRRMLAWYSEKLEEAELAGSMESFPWAEWTKRLDRAADLVDRLSKLSGVTSEAIHVSLTQNNLNVTHGSNGDADRPPGIALDDEKMRGVVADILVHLTQQAQPVAEEIIPTNIVQKPETR
jgi:hypothetical protein